MGLFDALQTQISSNLPNDNTIQWNNSNGYYFAVAQRVSPATTIDWLIANSTTNLYIPASITENGREEFSNYDEFLDSADIFAIQWDSLILEQCDGVYVIPSLSADETENSDTCGFLQSDALRVEIAADDIADEFEDNIVISFATDLSDSCDFEIVIDDDDDSEFIFNDTFDATNESSSSSSISKSTSCAWFEVTDSYDVNGISNSWQNNVTGNTMCISSFDNDSNVYTCECNHLTTFGVREIVEYEINVNEVDEAELEQMPFEYYFLLGGFVFVAGICLLLMYRTLSKGLCKIENVVLIYYVILVTACYQVAVCIYLGNNEAFLLMDVANMALKYVLLAMVLNTWFRLTLGTKKGRRAFCRVFLNIVNILIILYIVAVIVLDIWVTEVMNIGIVDQSTQIVNVVVCGLAGICALLWLLWRPISFVGIKICEPDEISRQSRRGSRKLYIILLFISLLLIVETLFVVFYNFSFLSYLDDLMDLVDKHVFSYIPIEYGNNEIWRFVNYCIDLLILLLILSFYVPITWYSVRHSSYRPSQFESKYEYDDSIDRSSSYDAHNINNIGGRNPNFNPNNQAHVNPNGYQHQRQLSPHAIPPMQYQPQPGGGGQRMPSSSVGASVEVQMSQMYGQQPQFKQLQDRRVPLKRSERSLKNMFQRAPSTQTVNEMVDDFKDRNVIVDKEDARKHGLKRFAPTFYIVVIGLIVLLGEDLLCLFFYDSEKFGDQTYFWILFAYTVITNYIQIGGLLNSTLKTVVYILVEGVQAAIYAHLTQNCEIAFGYTSYYVFGAIFALQMAMRLAVWCMKQNKEVNDDQIALAQELAIARCFNQVYVAVCTIPLIYFDEISPFRQLWYDVLYTINLWMSFSLYDLKENILDHTVSNENILKVLDLAQEKFGFDVKNVELVNKLSDENKATLGNFIESNLNRLQNDNNLKRTLKLIYSLIQGGIGVVVLIAQIDYFTYVEAEYDRIMLIIFFSLYGVCICCFCCAGFLQAIANTIEK